MRIPSALRYLIPLALAFDTSCISDEQSSAAEPDGGSAGAGGASLPTSTGGDAAQAGGRAGAESAGGAGGGGAGSGGAGSGGTGGRTASTGGSSATGGSQTSGGASGTGGAGGSLSFQCADSPPAAIAPSSEWVNATGNLAGMASECGNLGLVSANPCSNMVIAGVAKAGLWGTEDGGKNWKKLGGGAGSAAITNRISALVYDPAHPGTFWESGIYNGGGVYRTTNNGETFEQLGDVTHTDSVSVDFTDPDRKTLLAGPHEQTSKVFRSTDGGKSWNDVGKSLPASAGFCTATQVLGAANLLVGCAGGGVFHSTDGAAWASLGTKGVIPQPLLSTDGTLYWPGSQGGISVSTDQGKHFTQAADGNLAPGIVGSLYPAELPDGRVVIIGKDHLLISADKGVSWKPIGQPLPYPGGGYDGARGPAYSARTRTFYVWRWDCGNSVVSNAIMSAGFDYTKE